VRLNSLIARLVTATALVIFFSAHAPALAKSASGASSAARPASPALANIRIDNFGQINSNYYRGAQPEGQDYEDLAALGVRTVIDLTKDGRSDEAAMVKGAGMRFVRIPLTTTDRPSDQAVADFLKLVTDPASLPVYVHCQGGRHRTGTMTAVYRMTVDGWTADQAYAEMRQYKFEGFPGHPELKSFVYDYPTQLGNTRIVAAKR
jgi:protein tyrosine/serine phosphatase